MKPICDRHLVPMLVDESGTMLCSMCLASPHDKIAPFIGPGYLPASMFEFQFTTTYTEGRAGYCPLDRPYCEPEKRDGPGDWALVSAGVSGAWIIAVWARRKA